MPTGELEKHIFVSYVRENAEAVDRLCRDLRANGVSVWIDRDKIVPGVFWADAIRRAIQNGAYFLACYSRARSQRAISGRRRRHASPAASSTSNRRRSDL